MAESQRKRAVRVSPDTAIVSHRIAGANWSYIATNSDYAHICRLSADEICKPRRSRIRAAMHTKGPSRPTVKQSAAIPTVCFSRLTDLTDEVVSRLTASNITKHILFVSELPIEATAARLKALRIRSLDRLHLARKENQESEGRLIRRFFAGMMQEKGNPTIADAWIERDQLVLLSASFQRLRVPRAMLDRFLGSKRERWQRFDIDEDGRFLYWPDADVHFGWKQLEQLIDPTKAIADQKKTEEFKRLYGNAIRVLRESMGLKQTEIDGLTDRQVRRIEHGEQMVSSKALESLAKAHGLEISEYMSRLATLSGAR